VSSVINLFEEMRISHILTVFTSNEEYRHIEHPVVLIILFFLAYYGLGINTAKREKKIARRKLSPKLRWILFFNQESRFTLNTILIQIYLMIVTISCLLSILIVPDINPSRVASSFVGRLFLPFIIMHAFFSVRGDILGKKRKK